MNRKSTSNKAALVAIPVALFALGVMAAICSGLGMKLEMLPFWAWIVGFFLIWGFAFSSAQKSFSRKD